MSCLRKEWQVQTTNSTGRLLWYSTRTFKWVALLAALMVRSGESIGPDETAWVNVRNTRTGWVAWRGRV